jgi:hypothetical protein
MRSNKTCDPHRLPPDKPGGGGNTFDDLTKLGIDPTKIAAAPRVPAKIKKRREDFIMVPIRWKERLGEKPCARGPTHQVALELLYLDWKNLGRAFKLPNGTLRYDGINRFTKWRALADLERRGLIRIERRQRRSPIIEVLAT